MSAKTKNKKEMDDIEVCRAIIALAILVVTENGGHDIRFVKEKQ